ncbi:MAG: radical SAM/SPASM domain-containing protein [Mobilitalea sp.]
MFDIKFYQMSVDLKAQLGSGKVFDKEYLFEKLESFRSSDPVIYNIETTNACNMRCVMCPRTTMMKRPIETMDFELFKKIVDQIKPHSDSQWQKWEDFCQRYYHISKNDMSENHFFLYIIPKVIVLHGYGDPLLDVKMPERVALLTERNIPSYFSCNPMNINIERTAKLFEKGLGYIKFSIESISDLKHKKIRGEASDFTESFRKLSELLKIKKDRKYKTVVVITMLNLQGEAQENEFHRLKDSFRDFDVYIYLKSQDQKWYSSGQQETKSLHWIEFCQFPWSSMTVKSNGQIAMCVEDFDNEIILGDARSESLYDVWNGKKYEEFRRTHLELDKKIKCTTNCDMKLIGKSVSAKEA